MFLVIRSPWQRIGAVLRIGAGSKRGSPDLTAGRLLLGSAGLEVREPPVLLVLQVLLVQCST